MKSGLGVGIISSCKSGYKSVHQIARPGGKQRICCSTVNERQPKTKTTKAFKRDRTGHNISISTVRDRGHYTPFASAILVSALAWYALMPSGVALMVASPGFQLAGHTSPYLSVNWKASMRRRVSSTLRPTGRSLMVIWMGRGMCQQSLEVKVEGEVNASGWYEYGRRAEGRGRGMGWGHRVGGCSCSLG